MTINLSKEKYNFSELTDLTKGISYMVDSSRIDWSDLWVVNFLSIDSEELYTIWYYVKTYGKFHYLIRVLFARYGARLTAVMHRMAQAEADENCIVLLEFYDGKISLRALSTCSRKYYCLQYNTRPTRSFDIRIPWLRRKDLKPYPIVPESICYRNGRLCKIYKTYIDF